jgi:ribosome-associated translation inhibitor RaiA
MQVSVTLELDGSVVHAHADARSLEEAIDLVGERIRRQLVDARGRARSRRTRTGVATEEWRHGDRTEHP